MSATEKTSQNYISKVHLKGYKSIQDVEIDLLPGMNIMIGPNGSGKTNFLEAVNTLFESDSSYYNVNVDFYLQLFLNKNNIEIKTKQKEPTEFDDLVFDNNFEFSLIINGEKRDFFKSPKVDLYQSGLLFQYLRFFIPSGLLGINLLTKIKFDKKNNEAIFGGIPEFPHYSYFSAKVFSKLKKVILDGLKNKQNLKVQIVENFEIDFIADVLKLFSPIKKVKISEGVRVGESENEITIDFYHIEFFVNNQWLLWNDLSDGTRRLFYVVSEILSAPFGIFLIDEPELGLHPQQLHSLMQFLNEQSETKQIILTTHSPQVLNFLKVEELNRLIVCRMGENGTEMVKLSEEEKQWAKNALGEGLSLSDYWVYSGIEAENLS